MWSIGRPLRYRMRRNVNAERHEGSRLMHSTVFRFNKMWVTTEFSFFVTDEEINCLRPLPAVKNVFFGLIRYSEQKSTIYHSNLRDMMKFQILS